MENITLWLTGIPAAGALLALFLPKDSGKAPLRLGLLVSTISFFFGVALFVQFQGRSAEPEFIFHQPWFLLGGVPVNLDMGADGISLLLICLTTLLMPIVFLIAPGHIQERQKEFVFWALLMETGMIGVFASLDLVLFYVFWEMTLIPLYFIIGIWGGPRKLYATIKFFLYTLAGSLLMLIGVILLILETRSADLRYLATVDLSASVQMTCFVLFALAFAVKVPMLPFHTWLPDAHVEAPTSGSVILAGVLLKMGTYGFLRFCLPIFPDATLTLAPYLMALGAAGALYGAFLAWAQPDLKKLVAYSSVSHMGLIVMGLFALNTIAVQGSLIQMINHGLSTGALFLLVGVLYERRHTREISDFGGLAKVMPWFAIVSGIVFFSSIALPGLNGFIGEFLILNGSFQSHPWITGVGALSVIFGAVYMLSALRRILFGKVTKPENQKLADLRAHEMLALVPLVILIVWIGVAPKCFLQKSEASIQQLIQRVHAKEAK